MKKIFYIALSVLLLNSCSSKTQEPKLQDNVKAEAVDSDDFDDIEGFDEDEFLTDTVSFDTISLPKGVDTDFVLLSDIVPDVIQEIRYFSTYNFVGRRIPGYEEPVAIMVRKAANALKKVSDELVEKGYRLKVFDAYRPMTAVRYFVKWAHTPSDTLAKKYFYPVINKADVFRLGYISSRSAHARGATIDLTLFDMNTEKEVDMGGPFDFFGEISHPGYRKGLTEEQVAMRMLLRETMVKYGFKPVSSEWWHFTLRNEPFPDQQFDFPVNSESITKNK